MPPDCLRLQLPFRLSICLHSFVVARRGGLRIGSALFAAHPSLCEDDIIAAFHHYQGSVSHLEVHQQIRRHVDNMTQVDLNLEDNTHIEVERLINSHRRILIDRHYFVGHKR